MHFCSNCENMYYLKLSPENDNQLIYYCRNCGTEDLNLKTSDNCVLSTQISSNDTNQVNIVNEYTKFDVTLPRTSSIRCPNQNCETNIKSEGEAIEREIIYVRYDNDNMKYLYLCSHCSTTWKTNDKN